MPKMFKVQIFHIVSVDDLKTVKHLNVFQLIQYLVEKEGVQSLYKGLIPVMQSSCISNFVYFYVFHFLKRLRGKEAQSALGDLLLGAIAGSVNVLSTTPFWVVNTRLKMQGITADLPYKDLIGGLKYISKHEGIQKLWSGTMASLLLVSNPAIQFSVYETIKRQLVPIIGDGKDTSVFIYFLIGAVAKLVATFLTYPVQIIQTKMRHGHKDQKEGQIEALGTFEMLKNILKSKGIAGLYSGFEAKVWQTVLTAALMFMTYEKIIKFVKVLLGGANGTK
jgi:solute carrier family 25 (peroxisomal adenine nucleotide transporter), member 17